MSELTNQDINTIAQVVQEVARENRNILIKDGYDTENPTSSLDGLCYVASESLYHLTGGKDNWTPKQLEHEGVSHWFLVHKKTGNVYDLTSEQFEMPVPYGQARGRGFCTGEPSNRSMRLIQKVKNRIDIELD